MVDDVDSCALTNDMSIVNVREVVERCVPVGATEASAVRFLRRNHLEYRTEEGGKRVIAILREAGVRTIKTGIAVEFRSGARVSERTVGPLIELP